jgi:hypothetical protein
VRSWRSSIPGRDARAQRKMELAKWVATAAMAVDHYGKIVDPAVFELTHAVGRVSFPLFAAIIAERLILDPQLARRYLRRLAPWAVVSQPVYVLAGRDWLQGSILLTLLLGVLAIEALRGMRQHPVPSAAGLAVVAAASWFAEFGPPGVALIPLVWAVARRSGDGAAMGALAIAAVAVNVSLEQPYLEWWDMPAALSPVVLLLSRRSRFAALPRLPTPTFYAFYPAHLLALHLWDLYL